MKQLRIVNAMFARGLGGIEQALVDYSEAMRLAGHEVLTIINPHAGIRKTLEEKQIPFITLSDMGAWDVIAWLKLRHILNGFKPDICVAHGNRAVSLLRYSGKRKIIAPMHNYKIKCAGLTGVICPIKDTMTLAAKNGIDPKCIFHIPNMVHVPATRELIRHNPVVIGCMGRFVPKKGVHVFIEALHMLKSRGIIFRAVIAGDGEEAGRLKQLTSDKDLESEVAFTGWVKDKKTFFESIDIFCLPSLHEPFGIVLLEAMAETMPIVSADSEGPSEILEHAKNGLLVAKGNAEKLADALAELIENEAKAKKLAQVAYATAKSTYDLPVISAKLALALDSVYRL